MNPHILQSAYVIAQAFVVVIATLYNSHETDVLAVFEDSSKPKENYDEHHFKCNMYSRHLCV